MAPYDLLGNRWVVGRIPEQVFADIDFEALLHKFFTEKQVSNILAVLSRPLSAEGIMKRQELFLELEKEEVRAYFSSLKRIVQDLEYRYDAYHQQSNPVYQAAASLALAETYCEFVDQICDRVIYSSAKAAVLKEFIETYLKLQGSVEFVAVKNSVKKIRSGLQAIGSVRINIRTPDGVPLSAALYQGEDNHLAFELEQIAAKFGIERRTRRNHSEGRLSGEFILGLAKLHPELFAELESFHNQYGAVITPKIFAYSSQIAFYRDLHSFFSVLRRQQIPLFMPKIAEHKQVSLTDAYDLSLLLKMQSGIIPNDISFSEAKGFYLVTGANSGGKTAYLRTVAICQILFSAGAYVPAVDGEMYPFQQLFTQFPADESGVRGGRLKDEQDQITAILNAVNEDTLVLLNETFSSTSEEIAVDLCVELISKLCAAGAYGLLITHHHRIYDRIKPLQVNSKIGRLTAVVLDDAANTRTFKIVAEETAAQSYAQSILEKYGLTRSQLVKRLREVVEC